jgi:hypothetical protein
VASFTVVYDACVLYPAPLRDLLIRLARTGLFKAKWTEEIVEESFRSILRDLIDLAPTIVWQVVQEQAAALRNPRCTANEVLDRLNAVGLVRSVAQLRTRVVP